MNYCTKCQSLYAAPGTCNCYAPQNMKVWTSGGEDFDSCNECIRAGGVCQKTVCPKTITFTTNQC
jgi:hypothetical protein